METPRLQMSKVGPAVGPLAAFCARSACLCLASRLRRAVQNLLRFVTLNPASLSCFVAVVLLSRLGFIRQLSRKGCSTSGSSRSVQSAACALDACSSSAWLASGGRVCKAESSGSSAFGPRASDGSPGSLRLSPSFGKLTPRLVVCTP